MRASRRRHAGFQGISLNSETYFPTSVSSREKLIAASLNIYSRIAISVASLFVRAHVSASTSNVFLLVRRNETIPSRQRTGRPRGRKESSLTTAPRRNEGAQAVYVARLAAIAHKVLIGRHSLLRRIRAEDLSVSAPCRIYARVDYSVDSGGETRKRRSAIDASPASHPRRTMLRFSKEFSPV